MEKNSLIIVESPTKAKTIRNFLGNGCRIIASKGHIRKIPEDRMSIDFSHGYRPEYVIDEKKKSVIEEMKEALKSSDELILATDEDREGESISWHLLQVLKPEIPYRRMVFHEITKKAILEALENGRDIDMKLVQAQETRRVLDRLFGYTLSPVLWSKLGIKTLSAGRVQSPGLRLIVEREKKRMNFRKSEYWDLRADFANGFSAGLDSTDGKKIATGKDFNQDTGEFSNQPGIRLLTNEDALALSKQLKTEKFVVSAIDEKEFSQHPAPPFMTSTLQQEGNRKLHMTARETMKYAQSLYEKGFITYMRTDSLTLSEEGTKAARDAAVSKYGTEFVSPSPRKYASKSANAQEAHEAIRPAGETFLLPEETGLTGKELQLYTLIFKRTLACQMKDAKKTSTSVAITAGKAVFTATGVRTIFPGFAKIYTESSDSDEKAGEKTLPKLSVGTVLNLTALEPVSHETREPVRFTEASLVQELEKLGIGRPSTYATIIDRLEKQKYVIKEGSALVPTFIGFAVMQVLDFFPEYIEYKFTSDMENDLDGISNGKIDEKEYLKKFYEGKSGLEEKVEQRKKEILPAAVKTIRIPQLSDDNTVLIGKFGPYVKNRDGKLFSIPEQLTPQNITDRKIAELEQSKTAETPVIGTTPEGRPIYFRTGKFGNYWQLGTTDEYSEVQNFKIPGDLLNTDVPVDTICGFFSLPRVIGKDENGEEISCAMGKFGPFIRCGEKYAHLKSSLDLLKIQEDEARTLLSNAKTASSKASGYKTDTRTAKRPGTETSGAGKAEPEIVKNFGTYLDKPLDIRKGRYGYYLKHGTKNYRIPSKYRDNAQECANMELDEAISCIK